MPGRVPVEVEVVLAQQRLAETIAAYEAKCARRAAVAAPGRRGRGRLPVPVEQYCRVRQAQARLEQARAAEATRAEATETDERTVNITDPQSRIQPLRGGG